MKTRIIRLDAHDDVNSIRQKMGWSNETRILLVFPRRNPPSVSRLDLVLLKRCAEKLGGQLALASRPGQLWTHAREAGIRVFTSVPAAERQNWQLPFRQRRKQFKKQENASFTRRAHTEPFHKVKSSNPWLRGLVFLMGLLSVLALILLFIPRAGIYYSVETQPQAITIPVRVSPAIRTDVAAGGLTVEAVKVIVEGEMESQASDYIWVGETSASGIITATNVIGDEIIIPAETVFITAGDNPIRFKSINQTKLPQGIGSEVNISINAILPGITGNVEVGSIQQVEGDLGLVLSVTNLEATSGGRDRSVIGAGDADFQNLSVNLMTILEQDEKEKLIEIVGHEKLILDQTLLLEQILSEERFPDVGSPADTIKIKMKVEFSAWTADRDQIRTMVTTVMDGSIPAGFRAAPDTLRLEHVNFSPWESGEALEWQIRAVREILKDCDPQVIEASIAGLPVDEAEWELIHNYGFKENLEIRIWPEFWKRLPYLSAQINLVQK